MLLPKRQLVVPSHSETGSRKENVWEKFHSILGCEHDLLSLFARVKEWSVGSLLLSAGSLRMEYKT
jgi:hypothetical protein